MMINILEQLSCQVLITKMLTTYNIRLVTLTFTKYGMSTEFLTYMKRYSLLCHDQFRRSQ